MNKLEQQIEVLKKRRKQILMQIASKKWKDKNPEWCKNYNEVYQPNYRKKNAKELAKKARLKRKKYGAKINARRRELHKQKHGL